MLLTKRNPVRRIGVIALLTALTLCALCAPRVAQAQSPQNLQFLGGLLKVGGYYPTSSSGTQALGTPKFFSEAAYYVRPAHIGGLTLTGGAETVSVRDHFFPFSGGNDFSLIGASARISTPHRLHSLRPYLSVGYFLGHIRSENQGFDKTQLVPSMSLGAEYLISRTATLGASYRFSGQINGVNTDGFAISLRLF